MKRWIRNLVFIFAVLVFCTMAPASILYTAGYRYQFRENRLVKVGVIVVNHSPIDAITTVNGARIALADRAFGLDRAQNLWPGWYDISVTKDGYQSWEKRMESRPDLASWARYVLLFREQAASTLLFNQADSFYFLHPSPSDRYGLALSDHQAIWFDSDSTRTLAEFSLPQLFTDATRPQISWDHSESRVLLRLADNSVVKYFILTKSSETVETLTNLDGAESVRFDPSSVDRLLVLKGRALNSYSLQTGQFLSDTAPNVYGLDTNYTHAYYVQWADGNVAVLRHQPTGLSPEMLTTFSSQPQTNLTFRVVASEKEKVAVLGSNGFLWVIREDGSALNIAQNIIDARWAEDNDHEEDTDGLLLYRNSNELFVFDPLINNSESITRFSEAITTATWLPNLNKHLVFAVGNKIKVIELDEQSGRITQDLLPIAQPTLSLMLARDGKTLYYLSGAHVYQATIR